MHFLLQLASTTVLLLKFYILAFYYDASIKGSGEILKNHRKSYCITYILRNHCEWTDLHQQENTKNYFEHH